mmetsp:Transcript_9216/g.16760  ORF Transcript_9216/g.16760 Transcript_9216/m.16760 type:complete len:418 (-) Transcript_9216:1435-2688(-)
MGHIPTLPGKSHIFFEQHNILNSLRLLCQLLSLPSTRQRKVVRFRRGLLRLGELRFRAGQDGVAAFHANLCLDTCRLSKIGCLALFEGVLFQLIGDGHAVVRLSPGGRGDLGLQMPFPLEIVDLAFQPASARLEHQLIRQCLFHLANVYLPLLALLIGNDTRLFYGNFVIVPRRFRLPNLIRQLLRLHNRIVGPLPRRTHRIPRLPQLLIRRNQLLLQLILQLRLLLRIPPFVLLVGTRFSKPGLGIARTLLADLRLGVGRSSDGFGGYRLVVRSVHQSQHGGDASFGIFGVLAVGTCFRQRAFGRLDQIAIALGHLLQFLVGLGEQCLLVGEVLPGDFEQFRLASGFGGRRDGEQSRFLHGLGKDFGDFNGPIGSFLDLAGPPVPAELDLRPLLGTVLRSFLRLRLQLVVAHANVS